MIPEFNAIGFYSHCGNDELNTLLLDVEIWLGSRFPKQPSSRRTSACCPNGLLTHNMVYIIIQLSKPERILLLLHDDKEKLRNGEVSHP